MAHARVVALEARFPEATRETLARRGHRLRVGESWSEGRLSGCARETTPEGTVLKAAACRATPPDAQPQQSEGLYRRGGEVLTTQLAGFRY